jgi:hypothetical protein
MTAEYRLSKYLIEGSTWFDTLSLKQKKEYLSNHPDSKYGVLQQESVYDHPLPVDLNPIHVKKVHSVLYKSGFRSMKDNSKGYMFSAGQPLEEVKHNVEYTGSESNRNVLRQNLKGLGFKMVSHSKGLSTLYQKKDGPYVHSINIEPKSFLNPKVTYSISKFGK